MGSEMCIRDSSSAVRLPYPRKGEPDCHFSFSGLKTAVAQRWAQAVAASNENVNDFAASLQQAITVSLCDRVKQALVRFAESQNERRLVIAGGVAANQQIGAALKTLANEHGFEVFIPPAALCTDNGAMIAWVGHEYKIAGKTSSFAFAPRPRWPLDDAAPPPPGRGVRN